MNVKVTRDDVTILNKDALKIHTGEYKANLIYFDFSDEYGSGLLLNALFTLDNGLSFQVSIFDNKCHIPSEVLNNRGHVLLGVYAYKTNGEKLELRYSPHPDYFNVQLGSYDPTAEESQEITPTQFEQYMQALQNGLNQVQESIKELNQATNNANDLVDEINQKLENGEFIGPQGPQGEVGPIGPVGPQGPQGPQGEKGDKGDTGERGPQGEKGPQGEQGIQGEKGDKGDTGPQGPIGETGPQGEQGPTGATGPQGPQGEPGNDGQDGITPNIQIGDVTTLEPDEQATVTRTGTDEEPLLNFGIPKGQKGDPGEVTEETLDNVIPKQTATDSIININDALKYKSFGFKVDGNYNQKTSDGSNLLDIDYSEFPKDGTELHTELNDDYSFTVTGTKTTTTWSNINFSFKNIINFKQGVTYYLHDITVYLRATDGSYVRNESRTSFTAEQDMYCEGSGYWTTNTPGVINKTLRPYLGIVPYDESKYYKYTGGIASPNPDYSQEITPLNFDKITKIGQNLYNVRDAYTEGYDPYNSAYQVDEDDWVTLNIQGAPSDYNYYSLYTNNLKLKPDTDYNIILEVKEKSGLGTLSVVSQRIEGETQVEGQFDGSFSNTFGNFGPGIYTKKLRTLNKEELENTVCGLRTFISLDKGSYSSMTFRISVIEDTSVTPDNFVYQPYQEDNYSIDLQDNEMVSLPNGFKDELQIDKEGNVNLIKRIGKKIINEADLNGINDTWFTLIDYLRLNKPNDYIGYNKVTLSNSYNNTLLNKFYRSPKEAPRETYDDVYSIIEYQSTSNFALTIPKGTTLEQAREMTVGTIMYYELAEPQTISLGKLSDIIKTEQGSNTFAINGNIDTQISTTYALDLKKYIDNKIATVSQAVIEQE